MDDLFVYKVLAYADELKIVKSSSDEFQMFLKGISRTDFADRDVIAVQFAFSIVPDCLDDAEETAWFINPSKVRIPPYCAVDIYGSKLPAGYPPYLLLLANSKDNILEAFDRFETDIDFRTNYLESFKEFSAWYKSNG